MFNRRSGSVSFGIVQLTTTSLLALRALVLLARSRRSEMRATAASLAVDLGTSSSQVTKVLSTFVDEGLIHAHRGRGGGLEISEAGLSATADTVVARAEGGRPRGAQGDGSAALSIGRLPEALEVAQKAYLDALSEYTIAALAATPPEDLGVRGVPTIGSPLR